MAGSDRWQVVSTPEAVRPSTPLSGRPGEGSIGAKRSPTKSASRRSGSKRHRGRCGTLLHVLAFVPWGALVACAFMVTGAVLFGIHGKTASEKSQDLFDMTQSSSDGGAYGKYFQDFDLYWLITICLASGCIVASCFLALARLDLKLRKDGRSKKENWSQFRLNCTRSVGLLGLLCLLGTTIWLLLNGLLLTAWGWSMLTLKDAAGPAVYNFEELIQTDKVSEVATLQMAKDFICPSKACFNLAYYSWLNSNACMCSEALIVAMQTAAGDALDSVLWTLTGIACLFVGGLFGSVQGAADLALLSSDWDYLRVRAARRATSASPTRRTYTDFLQTPSAMKNSSSAYQIHARSAAHERGFNRSPKAFMEN